MMTPAEGRHIRASSQRPTLIPYVVLRFLPLLALVLTGCGTLTSVAQIVPTVLFRSAETQLLNALGQPTIVASAGPDQLALAGDTLILDGSGSQLVSAGGSVVQSPNPPLTFAWSVVQSSLSDVNNDGVVDQADLTLAGVRLRNADTAFPQFTSAVPGTFFVQSTVTWTDSFGRTMTATDVAQIGVSTRVP